ncbi:hypothetical protein [Spirosoma pollinicola]|uniref:Lipocalin-like domain-containing protein n=1 Tax=Spirosoma pollinicola TaxID=2057025 RepID=A0A2K8Z3V3_9BACT|nr:hypothetical protein [Spirosoma pollinicola]AUD04509.1 hypothetical protein CWM47_23280 [Spirosoma pollinicola]
MKIRYALLVLITVIIAACSKKNDIAPSDPATQVAGTYEMSTLRYDSAGVSIYNLALPITGAAAVSGAITVRRDSATVVYTTYTIKQTGFSDFNDTFGQLKLKGTTSPYDIYYGANKIGSTDGKTFTIDYSYTDQGITYREVYAGQKK